MSYNHSGHSQLLPKTSSLSSKTSYYSTYSAADSKIRISGLHAFSLMACSFSLEFMVLVDILVDSYHHAGMAPGQRRHTEWGTAVRMNLLGKNTTVESTALSPEEDLEGWL